MNLKKIENIRPIINITDNVIISRLGSYSVCFKIELKPVFTMTENDYEKCADDFSSILKILPDNSILHKMDVFYTAKEKYQIKIMNMAFRNLIEPII